MPLPWRFVSESQIPSTKFQINHKFQIPNRFETIGVLFGILNFGHCYLFVFWDLLFEISTKQIPLGDNQSLIFWAGILYFLVS
jgi:hypothetical protein